MTQAQQNIASPAASGKAQDDTTMGAAITAARKAPAKKAPTTKGRAAERHSRPPRYQRPHRHHPRQRRTPRTHP